MARPSRDTIQSGVNGWDASTNDNFIRLYDRPLAIHEHVGDESDLASTFAAASYDNCIVWVNHTVDGWVPYHSDGSTWDKLFSRFSSTFTAQTDTPASYSGDSLKLVRVNVGETALEFITPPAGDFLGLTDVTPSSFTGQASKVVSVNVGETALEFTTPAAATTFLGLSDVTPSSFTGQASKVVSVNTGETALEFTTPAAGGGAMPLQALAAVGTADSDENLLLVCTGTTYTVTLPSASTVGAGHRLTVKRKSSGTITLDGDSTDTIDDSTTIDLDASLMALSLVSDGTSNWHVI